MTTATIAQPQPHTAAASRVAAGIARELKIAYLVNQYPMTSQSFIRREIRALEALGVNVQRFAVRRWANELVDENDKAEQAQTRVVLEAGKLPIIGATLGTLLRSPGKFFKGLGAAIRIGRQSGRGVAVHLAYLAEACVLLGWLKKAGIQHVHAHFGTNSTTVALLCRYIGGPTYSFTCHGPEEFEHGRAIALAEKVRNSAFTVGISDFGCSQLYRWTQPSDWTKVKQVHCGVDEMFLSIQPTPPPAAPRIVNIGRLCAAKGQTFLVEAVARLVAQGVPIHLTLVGDGELRGPIEKMIAQHQIQENVRLAGWMNNEQVRQEILSCRALVLPSFAEGLPLVVMESLALHRPVVTTYIAGIPELVKQDVNGWLVPAGSIDALTKALRELLAASPSDLQRMGAAGAAAVAERHNAMTEAGKLKTLFEQVIASA